MLDTRSMYLGKLSETYRNTYNKEDGFRGSPDTDGVLGQGYRGDVTRVSLTEGRGISARVRSKNLT